MFTIREGTKEDCLGIEGLIRELYEYNNRPKGTKLVDREQLERDGFGEQRMFRTLVAQMNDSNQLIGYILYFNQYSTWNGRAIWMEDLYVQRQYRKHKVGLALMKALVKWAAEESYDRIEWICYEWNKNSHEFYKKFGAINLSETEEKEIKFGLNKEQITQLANSQ